MAEKKLHIGLSIGGHHHPHHHSHHRPPIHIVPTIVHQTTVMPPAPLYPSVPPHNPSYYPPSVPVPPQHYPPATGSHDASGAFSWVATSAQSCDSLLHRAVQVGHEGHDNSPIYLGRAWHEGDLLPCKVLPNHRIAYVSYNMAEVPVYNIELYCRNSPSVHWVHSSCGSVPPGAVPVGRTKEGETLFTARAYHEGSLIPGKVHSSHGCCYIPYRGQEISKPTYEVMTFGY